QVVEEGRPDLRGKLLDKIDPRAKLALHGKPAAGEVRYSRYRADGGIYTAEEALRYGLIDKVGYLEDALHEAKQAAGIGEEYKAVTYEKPFTLFDGLGGIQASGSSAPGLDPARLAEGAMPRLWYLAPGCEAAGILKSVGR